jgi:hypothetical protein
MALPQVAYNNGIIIIQRAICKFTAQVEKQARYLRQAKLNARKVKPSVAVNLGTWRNQAPEKTTTGAVS